MPNTKQITDEELLQDLKTTEKNVEGILTRDKYRENGCYTDITVANRFGSWNKGKEEAGLELARNGGVYNPAEKHVEKVEQVILENEINGRYSTTGLCEIVREETDVNLIPELLAGYIEALNERDNNVRLNRSRTSKPRDGHASRKVFVKNRNIDRWKKYKDRLPKNTHDLFDQLIGTGRSPKTIAAALTYITNHEPEDKRISKKAATERFGASHPGIIKVLEHLEEEHGEEVEEISNRGDL